MRHSVALLGMVVLLTVSACSGSANGPTSSIDGSVCGEYVAILTEESARFAELVEPGPNNFSPAAIALAQSEPWGAYRYRQFPKPDAAGDDMTEPTLMSDD